MTTWFRAHWPVRMLTFLAGVLGLVAVAAPAWLTPTSSHPGITLPAMAPLDAFRWTNSAVAPNTLQNQALAELLSWVSILGWGALVVGAITALALWASLAAQRVVEVAIRRAVGAGRRSLVGVALGEGFAVGLVSVLAGLMVAMAAARIAAAAWPGPQSAPGLSIPMVAVGSIMIAMVLGALLPLASARSRAVAEQVEVPPPLWIPAIQLGVGLAAVVGAAMVAGPARAGMADGGPARSAEGQVYQLDSKALISPEARSQGYGALLDQLGRDHPGALLSLASPGAHDGIGTVDQLMTDCGQCYVGGIFLKWRPLRANYHTASADTFRARGFQMVDGRTFTNDDRVGTAPVAIVNRYLADRYFEAGRPIGREVFLAGRMTGTAYRVIGVVDDRAPGGIGADVGPLETIYLSTLQLPATQAELLAIGGPEGLTAPNGVAVVGRRSRAAIADQRAATVRWFSWMFGLEGAVTLLLAAGGIVTLMTRWVNGSRIEFGIRRATGARRWDIRRFVLARAMAAAAAGVAVGVVFFGSAMWPELARLVPGLSYWQPGLVLKAAIVLVAVAIIGSIVPAWRASKASPAELASHL